LRTSEQGSLFEPPPKLVTHSGYTSSPLTSCQNCYVLGIYIRLGWTLRSRLKPGNWRYSYHGIFSGPKLKHRLVSSMSIADQKVFYRPFEFSSQLGFTRVIRVDSQRITAIHDVDVPEDKLFSDPLTAGAKQLMFKNYLVHSTTLEKRRIRQAKHRARGYQPKRPSSK
jgi:hypothetical protein